MVGEVIRTYGVESGWRISEELTWDGEGSTEIFVTYRHWGPTSGTVDTF